MGCHKLEPYVIQKAQSAKKFLAILLTKKNIVDVAKYLDKCFCKRCFVLFCNEELFLTTVKDEKISAYVGDYFVITDDLDFFSMKQNVFNKLFVKEVQSK